MNFTHLDEQGNAHMVDISDKPPSMRMAIARGKVIMNKGLASALQQDSAETHDHLGSARFAGILAAKQTSKLIPLCHPINVDPLLVEYDFESNGIIITCTARTYERTGVEMEALTGCVVTALTLYSSTHHLDSSMYIDQVTLWEKTGGKRGDWKRPESTIVLDTPSNTAASTPK